MLVWIVDDDPGNHTVARATVASLGGADFQGFFTGREALAAFAAAEPRPDVVLMDFYLGGERGDQVTRRLRALEPPGRSPVVVVGYSSARHGSELIVEAGGDAVVPKRRDPAGLNPDLRRFLASLPGADGG